MSLQELIQHSHGLQLHSTACDFALPDPCNIIFVAGVVHLSAQASHGKTIVDTLHIHHPL
jgi:hypothetical protein